MDSLDALCDKFMDELSKSILSGSDGYGGMTWFGKDKACVELKTLVRAIVEECKK